jgi:hypothetical protein
LYARYRSPYRGGQETGGRREGRGRGGKGMEGEGEKGTEEGREARELAPQTQKPNSAYVYDANELYTKYYIYALFTINYIMVLILASFRGSPLERSRLPTRYEHTLTLQNR